jgi:signal transduction histidine kinase
LRLAARIAALAAVYVLLAKLGLKFATVGSSVTLVWPPTGLALAALTLFSLQLWPAITIGAFVVNATTSGVGVATAAGMAAGNTLEAVVGFWLLQRFNFRGQLDRVRDVLVLTAVAGAISTMVSATIGSLSLLAGGLIPPWKLAQTFRVWWIGDLMGDLIIAPALLCWSARSEAPFRRSRWEVAALSIALLAASLSALAQPHSTRPYLVFPPLIWASLRFGPRGATAGLLAVSVITVWLTATGHGAFSTPALGESLIALHAFMASVALTSLFMGASTAERARALRVRENFISIASHELRTPLAAFRLHTQRILRWLQRDTTVPIDTITSSLLKMDGQIERVTHLLDDVLDLTRLRVDKSPLHIEHVDLCQLVAQVSDSLKDALANAGCTLALDCPPTPVVASCDRVRCERLMINLIGNAIKFGQGSPIEVALADSPQNVSIVVSDHGPGVATAEQERIFDEFQRAGGGETTSGLGLGLFIAREIVQAHHGQISVAPAVHGGAAFKVVLPREVVPGTV